VGMPMIQMKTMLDYRQDVFFENLLRERLGQKAHARNSESVMVCETWSDKYCEKERY